MTPITQRPVDAVYVAFFACHLVASLCIDGQAFYPPALVPQALKSFLANYIKDSADPLVSNVGSPRYVWFTTMMALEMLVQVPAFTAGIVGLWQDNKRVYPLLIGYASLAGFTSLLCTATILYGEERRRLTRENLTMLLGGYLPFTLIPLLMLIDMTRRTIRLIPPGVPAKVKDA